MRKGGTSKFGTEFTCLKSYFLENGIVHQTIIVGTQQNGRVNRSISIFLKWCVLCISKMIYPLNSRMNASYLINCTPSSLLKGKTPFKLLHGPLPTYSHISVFGCLAYVHDHDLPKDKFRSRTRLCVFLGYPHGKKGWKFMIWGVRNSLGLEMQILMNQSLCMFLVI